ncbi:MAG TPA: hypothetical protein VFY29_20395, partial [Terriglobia bacterium]|nr:hypothetical protein [Terriglobia bacterium]
MKKGRGSSERRQRQAETRNVPAQPPNTGWLIAIGLVALTLAVFWPVGGHGFLNYDDPIYVTENRQIQQGLTAAGARWAFSTFHAANW